MDRRKFLTRAITLAAAPALVATGIKLLPERQITAADVLTSLPDAYGISLDEVGEALATLTDMGISNPIIARAKARMIIEDRLIEMGIPSSGKTNIMNQFL